MNGQIHGKDEFHVVSRKHHKSLCYSQLDLLEVTKKFINKILRRMFTENSEVSSLDISIKNPINICLYQ